MSSNIYLFYSNACVHCVELQKTLKEVGILNQVKHICVDKVDHKKLPKFVKSVPTLLFKDTNQVIVGEKIFQWIETQFGAVSKPSSQKLLNAESSRSCGLPNNTSSSSFQKPEENIEAWRETEWGNGTISDSYSFIGDCPNGICRNFASIDLDQFSSLGGGGGGVTKPVNFLDRPGALNNSCGENDDNLQICNQRLQKMKMEREIPF
jgi:glutaredoxin